MQSTLSVRRFDEDEFNSYLQSSANASTHSAVALPSFSRPNKASDKPAPQRGLRSASSVQPSSKPGSTPRPRLVPNLVPDTTPATKARRTPLLVLCNRALRTVLVAMCGVAILGYGLDVAKSNEVGKLQDQARRLNEQNSELSGQLLQTISYQGIQANSLGCHGLQTAQHVKVVQQVPAPKVAEFKPTRPPLPVWMSGY